MGKRPPKQRFMTVTPDTREKARYLWTSWNEHLEKYANRKGTLMPVELKSDTAPLREQSLAAAVCVWIENQGEDFSEQWNAVLERVKSTQFLQKGYGNLKNPNLAWLFRMTPRGRGIDRVLEGWYDVWREGYSFSEDGV